MVWAWRHSEPVDSVFRSPQFAGKAAIEFRFGLFSFLRDLRAKGGILSDWLYRCRFALIGSASNHPIVSRCDITHGKPSVSIGARFEESEHIGDAFFRSEERRVGKECRSRWSPYH